MDSSWEICGLAVGPAPDDLEQRGFGDDRTWATAATGQIFLGSTSLSLCLKTSWHSTLPNFCRIIGNCNKISAHAKRGSYFIGFFRYGNWGTWPLLMFDTKEPYPLPDKFEWCTCVLVSIHEKILNWLCIIFRYFPSYLLTFFGMRYFQSDPSVDRPLWN